MDSVLGLALITQSSSIGPWTQADCAPLSQDWSPSVSTFSVSSALPRQRRRGETLTGSPQPVIAQGLGLVPGEKRLSRWQSLACDCLRLGLV